MQIFYNKSYELLSMIIGIIPTKFGVWTLQILYIFTVFLRQVLSYHLYCILLDKDGQVMSNNYLKCFFIQF